MTREKGFGRSFTTILGTVLASLAFSLSKKFNTTFSSTITSALHEPVMAVSTSQAPSLGLLLQAAKVATPFDAELRTAISQLPRPPTLCAILSTSNASSRAYATFSKTQCENLGVKFILVEVGAGKNRDGEEGVKFGEGEGVEGAIVEANEDPEVDGILVYHPIFGGRQVRDPAGVRSDWTEL